MDSLAIPLAASPILSATLPGWILLRGREPDETFAAFSAGIVLKSLDYLISPSSGPTVGARARP